jgi:hypothetical protein
LVTYKQYGDVAILFDGESSILVAEYFKFRWETYFVPAHSRIRGINVATAAIPCFTARTLEALCQIVQNYLDDKTIVP